MSEYVLSFGDSPNLARHSFCCRCQVPTENSPIGCGQVPVGPDGAIEEVRNIVLCVECARLMSVSPNQFWNTGWPNQKK